MNKLFENLLNKKVYKGICRKCGNHASHTIIYCKKCGEKFFRPTTKCTMWEMIKIADVSIGRKTSSFRPDYQAAVYKRYLKEHGFSDKEFQLYIENKLKDTHNS